MDRPLGNRLTESAFRADEHRRNGGLRAIGGLAGVVSVNPRRNRGQQSRKRILWRVKAHSSPWAQQIRVKGREIMHSALLSREQPQEPRLNKGVLRRRGES